MSNVEASLATPARPYGDSPAATGGVASRPRPVNWLGTIVEPAVLLIAYGPLLWLFFHQQWQKPHYQYFPFVIGAFAWLLWARWNEGSPALRYSRSTSWVKWGAGILQLIAFALLSFGLAIRSPWCAIVSLIVLVAATFLKLSQGRRIVNLWGIWLLLWLLVPAPFNLDQRLITRLQFVSSQLSSFVLDGLGVEHVMEGNTLALFGKQLFVDEACSGIISMLSIMACAVIFAVFKNRSPLHLVLLVVASILWATLINVVRISTIAYVLQTWGIDWSSGTTHEVLSLVLFLIAFGALLCTDQVLLGCLAPIRSGAKESYGGEIRLGKRLASAWDWITAVGQPSNVLPPEPVNARQGSSSASRLRLFGWLPTAMFAPLAAVQCVLLAYAFQRAPDRLPAVQMAVQLGANDLPEEFCGLKRFDFQSQKRSADNNHGKYSRTYSFRADDGTGYVVSFDFPFPGMWHELTECYVAAGWQPVERRVTEAPGGKTPGAPWKYVEARFAKSGGHFGTVYFAEFDQFGTFYEPQSDWLRSQGSFWASRNLYLKERQLFQVQVWAEGAADLNDGQRQKARELLLTAREWLRDRVVERSPVSSGS